MPDKTKNPVIRQYLLPKDPMPQKNLLAELLVEGYFRAIPLKLFPPYYQMNDGSIGLLIKSSWWKRDKFEDICRLRSDLEIFEIKNEKLFSQMCADMEFSVVEREKKSSGIA
ncbi:hypothetical protein FBU59_000399 [Linderina macrospora]|uniref:Uncharacterized protein n=1 Tax=Linderina macrospora TaxID=4868 RepID=A0ACC1JGX3_9FUNG|nr:hypothetical protein FBU59_000399 [Linderina macrospora]